MTTGIIIVLAIVVLTVVLFITEPIPIDVTALLVLVLLVILEPWTGIGPDEALLGFSNPATLTVLAMLILSAGVRRTGVIQTIGRSIGRLVGSSEKKQLVATVTLAGPPSGLMNNTPIVALLMPVISDMAHNGNVSPSRLLIPLSYASMLGGMLTLIGTSTNLLAGDLSRRLLGHPIGMFEFTGLGAIVLIVGSIYLVFAAPKLLPERIKPGVGYLEEFSMDPYLCEVRVTSASAARGKAVGEWLESMELEVEVLALMRGDDVFEHPYPNKVVRAGDVLLVHATQQKIEELLGEPGFEQVVSPEIAPEEMLSRGDFDSLVEVVIPAGSGLQDQTIGEAQFPERFDAFVLAACSCGEVIRDRLGRRGLRSGDSLLLQTTEEGAERLLQTDDLIVLRTRERTVYFPEKMPWMIAIVVAVVGLASFNVLPIVVAALAGVVAMVIAGVLSPSEMYDVVDWRVIFLLAGIIPLGMALERTGAAAYLGQMLGMVSEYLPAIAVLWLFYIATGLITEVISNNASVLLMIPLAVETAEYMDANPFAFVLAVMFAASTAFLGPVGYQTNLFVYGPGGYRVSDYVRIGAPLQLLMSIVTVAGISVFWGI